MYNNLSMPAELRKIEVFGSHTKLVEANQAVLRFTLSGQHTDPKTVISWITRKSEIVEEALGAWNISSIKSSRAKLSKRTRKVKDKTAAFVENYISSIDYWITTPEIKKITEIQMKLVELGVTEIGQTSFASSSLKRHRSEARRKAMKAARDKADLFCQEAGVRIGPPITIKDMNPDYMEGRSMPHEMRAYYDSRQDITEMEAKTSGPELIAVNSALQVVFEILLG